jgi:CheY-like chemotaxis protein
MSHELRTPLNSLLILARLLAQNPEQNLTTKQVEYARVIHSSGADLLQLINDILDLSRVEAGRLELYPERFALRAVVDDMRAIFMPLTTEKGLEFIADPPPSELPGELFTDRQRLRQILHNLLSNAVKFTEKGRVEFRIDAAPPGADAQQMLAFSVTDTGIGISAQNLEVIFGAFQQGDGTTSRRYGGTGLGLAICRELAGQLGGRIRAESVAGQGSTFTLLLPVSYQPVPAGQLATVPAGLSDGFDPAAGRHPVEPVLSGQGVLSAPQDRIVPRSPAGTAAAMAPRDGADPGPPEAGAEPRPAAGSRHLEVAVGAHESLRGTKVLIVDDDVRNVFAITGILELYGLTVLHAPDGQRGIEILRSVSDIDVVLMDVMMPELDGYSTTAAIRQLPGLASLPVIAVTARAMHGDRDKSIAAGASEHVTKPVDTEELLTCMERMLSQRGDPDPSDGQAAAPDDRGQ